jgi:hypothetical protein
VQYGQNVFGPLGWMGKYRVAADGQAQAGYWQDDDTFVMKSLTPDSLPER